MLEVPIYAREQATAAPLIGRVEEFQRLRLAWNRALAGQREVVFLSGEPGIGKTRVALEFMREAAGTDAVILYGRCVEDPVVPYEPFVQALQQLARSVPSAPDAAESVQSRLVALVPALSGALSGAEPPPPPDSATRRLVLFEGVRSALRAAATGLRPLLLVLDDLQWADLDSVRLLRYLTRGSWDTPALILGMFRDTDLGEPDGPLRAAIANLHSDGPLERMELCPFGPAQVRELAEESLGRPVSVEDEQWISAASGGNPFLAQEVIALVKETGHPPIGQVVPVGAREVISRRLSRLSSDCREVLTRASVLGGSADVALLEALWDGSGTTLSSSLDEAMRAALLTEEAGHYRFTHGIIQQTVYQSVPLPERQRLHLRAARALAAEPQRHGESRERATATQYRKAGDASPPQEGLPYALAAADAAVAAFALEDATDWWAWALELMESFQSDPRARARLLERMAGVLDSGREQLRATKYLEQALGLYSGLGDPLALATARSRLGRAHAIGNLRNTNLAAARADFEAAAPLLIDDSDRRRPAVFHASWGQLGVSSFRIADLRHAELAAEIIATLEWDAVGTMNHAALGMLAYHLGDLDTWMEASTKSWHEARARGDVIQSGGAAFLVGIGAQRLCDPRVAIEWLGPELDAWPAPAAAAPWGIAPRLVSALADAGDLPAMRALVREHTARDEERIEVLVERCAFAYFEGTWDGPVWAEAEAASHAAASRDDRCSNQNLGHWLVRAYWARREPERAVAFVEDELNASVSGGSLAQELVARAELAVLLAEGGDTPAASAHVARSREVFANAANRRGLEGKLLLAEALIAGATQGPDQAGVLFQQAVDVFRRYSTPWLEARAYEDWAHTLQRVRRHSKAGSQLRQAAAIYRRLGAGEPWFARLASLGGPDGSHLNAPDQTDGLTAREVEVLRLIARGRSNKQIANDLVLSVRTVERHIANIYVKAGVRTKAQATAYAFGHNVN